MKPRFITIFISALTVALLAVSCAPVATPSPVVEKETVVVTQQVVVTATPPPPEPVEPVSITYFTFSAAPDHLEHLDRKQTYCISS